MAIPLSSTDLLGQSICDVVLVNMATTSDMAGLSSGISWTQRSPIWIQRFSSSSISGSDLGSGTIVVSRSSMIDLVRISSSMLLNSRHYIYNNLIQPYHVVDLFLDVHLQLNSFRFCSCSCILWCRLVSKKKN